MLVENIKYPIRLVECGSSNLKVTTIDDMAVATEILRQRKEYSDCNGGSDA